MKKHPLPKLQISVKVTEYLRKVLFFFKTRVFSDEHIS